MNLLFIVMSKFHASVLDDCFRNQVPNSTNISDVEYYYYRPSLHGHHEMLRSMSEEIKNFNSEKALCPFQWNENIREDRFPEVLLTAACQNNVSYENTKDMASFTCEPVVYILPVLTIHVCDDGLAVYKQDWENITIACVPKFLPSSNVVRSSFFTSFQGPVERRESQSVAPVEGPN